jgi:hypothetical protein
MKASMRATRHPRTASPHGIDVVVVKRPAAKRGFVLVPKRGGIERSFAWTARFRRLPDVLASLRFLAVACLMLHQCIQLYSRS